jgi:hypothetical protein
VPGVRKTQGLEVEYEGPEHWMAEMEAGDEFKDP